MHGTENFFRQDFGLESWVEMKTRGLKMGWILSPWSY